MKRTAVLTLLSCLILSLAALAGDKAPGVVLIVNGNIGDKSFNDLAHAGLKRAEAELGIRIKLVENSYDTTKYEPSMIEFAEDPDYDILVLNSYDVKEIVETVAPQFPDKKFILYDSNLNFDNGDLENAFSMTFKQNEGSFIAGAMAAKLTSSGAPRTNPEKLIGFIAGGENAIINDFLIGYIEGCEYADPAARMFISYIGDFKNSAKGKEMALAQYMQKTDIIFQVAAGAGMGVLEAAKDREQFAIGVDSDQYAIFADSGNKAQADAVVTSMVKKIDDTVFNCIAKTIDGSLQYGRHEEWGLKDGAVGLVKNEYYRSAVPADIRAFVDETEKKIVSGALVVGTNIGQPTEFINEARNRIKP